MKTARFSRSVFWAFCLVVFSKIVWYDLRVYVPEDGRRDFMTTCFAIWILAHRLAPLAMVWFG